MVDYIIIILGGYLIGSIPFGFVLAKLAGHGDIRKIGSGNIGATNVLRTGNKWLALATLILDSGKGIFVILAMSIITLGPLCTEHFFEAVKYKQCVADALIYQKTVFLLAGLGAILGHCFPIWLKFKGGKGVSTTLGTLLAAVPIAGLIACVTWLIMAFAMRISSLSALTAMVTATLATVFFYGTAPAIIVFLIAALVFIRHKDNIKRIYNGNEPRIGDKKKNNEKPVSTKAE